MSLPPLSTTLSTTISTPYDRPYFFPCSDGDIVIHFTQTDSIYLPFIPSNDRTTIRNASLNPSAVIITYKLYFLSNDFVDGYFPWTLWIEAEQINNAPPRQLPYIGPPPQPVNEFTRWYIQDTVNVLNNNKDKSYKIVIRYNYHPCAERYGARSVSGSFSIAPVAQIPEKIPQNLDSYLI